MRRTFTEEENFYKNRDRRIGSRMKKSALIFLLKAGGEIYFSIPK
jgi:hypothetical protein